MFSHMETLSARYYNSHKTGDLMAYFTNDLQAVRMGTGMAVITTFDGVIMTIMVLVKMIVYVDFKLTMFAFVPLIFIAVGCYFYGMESKKRQVKRQDAFSFLSDKVQESIAGIRVVKAFVQEDEDFKVFEKACENSREKNLDVVKLRAFFGPALDAVIGISVIVTLFAGGKMVLDKIFKNSEGEFVSLIDVIFGSSDAKNYIYTLAEAHAIDLIAKTISKCEIQTFEKKDGKIKENKGDLYWTLNLQPNYNEYGTKFIYKLVT